MKKSVFLILILFLIGFVFVACAESDPSKPTPEPTPVETESPSEGNLSDDEGKNATSTNDTPEQTEATTGDAKAQMAGNWIWHETNPEHSARLNLFADGGWEKPPNFSGSFWIADEESGIYSLRLTIEHSAIPGVDLGFEYEEYFYDAHNDRLGMVVHSGEGTQTLWFARE